MAAILENRPPKNYCVEIAIFRYFHCGLDECESLAHQLLINLAGFGHRLYAQLFL